MSKKMIGTFLVIASLCFANVAENMLISPFGIIVGKQLDPKIKHSKINDSLFEIIPPQPLDSFTSYFATLNKNKVVTKLISVTDFYQNDGYCFTSRNKFIEFEKMLSKKYGEFDQQYDFTRADSIWDDERYYQMSLLNNERVHATFWKYKGYNITLEEDADYSGCYLRLTYEHEILHDQWIDEKEIEETKAL